MALGGQCALLSGLSLSTLRQRAAASLTIVITTVFVTGVLISMLSVTAGIVREYRRGNDPDVAIVLWKGSSDEASSFLERSTIGTILDAPDIARSADGKLVADAELLIYIHPTQYVASGGMLPIRGINAAGVALRPRFRIVSGRMFQPGRDELIVGTGAQRGFGLKVGDGILMRDGSWPIVGSFEAGGVAGDELMGDADAIGAMKRQSFYESVRVRLADRTRFAEFEHWLTTNPALTVSAQTLDRYDDRVSEGQSDYFTGMAYLAGTIMSLGALFGSIGILYGVVSARSREMAILRAIGYGASPVAASVVFEALLLSFAGAAIGGCVAWMLFDGREVMKGSNVYMCFVSPQLILFGVGWALVLALLGSLLPAVRAGRLQVVEALRAVQTLA